MEVRVKLFGPLSTLVEKRQLLLIVNHNYSVGDLISRLFELYPHLSDLLQDGWRQELDAYLIVLKNGEILTSEYLLKEGDEITIATPISGG